VFNLKNSTIWWIILIIIIILGAYFLFTSNENVNIDNQENIIPAEEINTDINENLEEATEPADNVFQNSEDSSVEILNENNKDIPISQ